MSTVRNGCLDECIGEKSGSAGSEMASLRQLELDHEQAGEEIASSQLAMAAVVWSPLREERSRHSESTCLQSLLLSRGAQLFKPNLLTLIFASPHAIFIIQFHDCSVLNLSVVCSVLKFHSGVSWLFFFRIKTEFNIREKVRDSWTPGRQAHLGLFFSIVSGPFQLENSFLFIK